MPHKYAKGAQVERLLKRQLELQGYHVVRSAGSKGRWDLVAIMPGCQRVQLIQVKALASGVSHVSARNQFSANWIPGGSAYAEFLYIRQDGKWHIYED